MFILREISEAKVSIKSKSDILWIHVLYGM